MDKPCFGKPLERVGVAEATAGPRAEEAEARGSREKDGNQSDGET